MWRTILFDLDGTLTDSAIGIINCVQYALQHLGIEVEDRSTLRCFIGPPLLDTFMREFDLNRQQAEEAVAKYRERYAVIGMFENEIYPGIDSLLEELRHAALESHGAVVGGDANLAAECLVLLLQQDVLFGSSADED